jgi:hypothetical protein
MPETDESRVAQPKWIGLVLLLGGAILGISRWMGDSWTLGDLAYDLGVALFTVALLQWFVLRIVVGLASRRTALEQVAADLRVMADDLDRRNIETDKRLKALQLDSMHRDIRSMDRQLTLLSDSVKGDLDAIRVRVDPGYAEVRQAIDERKRKMEAEPPPQDSSG